MTIPDVQRLLDNVAPLEPGMQRAPVNESDNRKSQYRRALGHSLNKQTSASTHENEPVKHNGLADRQPESPALEQAPLDKSESQTEIERATADGDSAQQRAADSERQPRYAELPGAPGSSEGRSISDEQTTELPTGPDDESIETAKVAAPVDAATVEFVPPIQDTGSVDATMAHGLQHIPTDLQSALSQPAVLAETERADLDQEQDNSRPILPPESLFAVGGSDVSAAVTAGEIEATVRVDQKTAAAQPTPESELSLTSEMVLKSHGKTSANVESEDAKGVTEQSVAVGKAASHVSDDQAEDVGLRQFPRLHLAEINDSETAGAHDMAQSSNIRSAIQNAQPAEGLSLGGKTPSADGGTDTSGQLESAGMDQVMLSASETEVDTISNAASVQTGSAPRLVEGVLDDSVSTPSEQPQATPSRTATGQTAKPKSEPLPSKPAGVALSENNRQQTKFGAVSTQVVNSSVESLDSSVESQRPLLPTEVTVPDQTATSQGSVPNAQPPEIFGPDPAESQRLLSGRGSRAKTNPAATNRAVATATTANAAVPLAVEASTGNNVAASSNARPSVTVQVPETIVAGATRSVPVVAAGVEGQPESLLAADELRQPAGSITSATSTAGTAKAAGSPVQQIADSRQLEFVNRVADAMRGAPTSGNQITVRLTPPELGTLQIEVSLRDGVMTAKMETETASAQRVIMDNLPQLKDALTQNGTLVDRFVVEQSDERGKQHATRGDQGSERESNTDDQSRDQRRRDDRPQTDQGELGEPDDEETDFRLSSIDELDIQI